MLVSVPDPKPTLAQIGFSIVHILEAIYMYVPDEIIYEPHPSQREEGAGHTATIELSPRLGNSMLTSAIHFVT